MARESAFLVVLLSLAPPAVAGPPYVTDDPKPTEFGHFEIYAFANGTSTQDGSGGAAGIDFNYGAGPDLQLTVAVPVGYENPEEGSTSTGLGNVEIAAKYRFLHQDEFGWDVAVFPRLFLPGGSGSVADTVNGQASTGLGAGVTYDLNEHYHLLASAGPGIQNADETNRLSWYAALLFTF